MVAVGENIGNTQFFNPIKTLGIEIGLARH